MKYALTILIIFYSLIGDAQVTSRCPVCPPSLNGVPNGYVLTDSSGHAKWQATGGGYWTKSGNYLYPTTIGNNVGIGTVSPAYKLTVTGMLLDSVRLTSGVDAKIFVGEDLDAAHLPGALIDGGYSQLELFDGSALGGGLTRHWWAIGNPEDGGATVVGDSNEIRFKVSGNDAPVFFYHDTIFLRVDSGTYFRNWQNGNWGRIYTRDSLFISSNLPIKIGNGSLVVAADGSAMASKGFSILGKTVTPPQYATPTTGTTVTSNGNSQLVVNPVGTLVALTIAFPSSPIDGQQFNIASTQILTGLTLTSSATILGTLTTLAAANGFAGWVYSSTASSWIRTR